MRIAGAAARLDTIDDLAFLVGVVQRLVEEALHGGVAEGQAVGGEVAVAFDCGDDVAGAGVVVGVLGARVGEEEVGRVFCEDGGEGGEEENCGEGEEVHPGRCVEDGMDGSLGCDERVTFRDGKAFQHLRLYCCQYIIKHAGFGA